MTPDIPKGPEGEKQQVSWATYLRCCEALGQARTSASTWQMRAEQAGPEVERLTAEVRRLTESRDRAIWLTRDLTDERDEWKQSAEAEAGLLDQANAEHKAEVSRLREQLAAQPKADLVERAAIWLFRAKTSQMLPDVLQRAYKTWHQVLDQHDRDAWMSYAREMLADLGWGVSSSEVEAPRQHKVFVRPAENGWWQATCPRCDIIQLSPRKERVEDWKDQHEADTLVPQLQANSKLEQNLDDAVLLAVAQDLVRRDKGVRHTLEDVAAELEPMDEGRPSGSERLTPRPVETPEVWVESPNGADYTATYETQLAPATVVEDAAQAARSEATPLDPIGYIIAGPSTADQASGRIDNPNRYVLDSEDMRIYKSAADGQAALEKDGPYPGWRLFELRPVPSPSLPKEGEDSV